MSLFQVRYLIKAGFFISVMLIILNSCNEKTEEPEAEGKIIIHFDHKVDGNSLEVDTLKYINAAGNHYMVSEVQYFISDVTLYNANGTSLLIDDWKDIHYVDTDLPDTHTWEVYDDIPAGNYDSIAFTFGISEEKNHSFMFVNPPESFMFWPEFLGGGYHYLKFNGKWLEEGQTVQTTPFNCHLGIGQIYFNYPDSIIGFIHNDFRVSLPGSSFEISSGVKRQINLTMHIEKWFEEPHIYDLNVWGSYTMQNQDAMQMLRKNGQNVFSVLIE